MDSGRLGPGPRLRVLASSGTDPLANLRLEEELLAEVEVGRRPDTLRLWIASPCLVRGRHRAPTCGWHDEQLAFMLGVPVHTRSTGGGTVYHDLGNLNWSFYLRRTEGYVGGARLFPDCAAIIVEALKLLGVEANFGSPNRIDVLGCKVSGLASRATHGAVLVHGTLLVSTDLSLLNALCVPPPGCPPVTRLCDVRPTIGVTDVGHAISSVASGEVARVLDPSRRSRAFPPTAPANGSDSMGPGKRA